MYEGRVEKRQGFFMDAAPDKAIQEYWAAAVVWKGKKIEHVAMTGVTARFNDKRGKASCQRSADALAKRYQSYYERTGKRWDIEERLKKEAKRNTEKANAAAKAQIRATAPELLDVLEGLVRDIRDFKLDRDNLPITNKLRRAEAVIKTARGVPEKVS